MIAIIDYYLTLNWGIAQLELVKVLWCVICVIKLLIITSLCYVVTYKRLLYSYIFLWSCILFLVIISRNLIIVTLAIFFNLLLYHSYGILYSGIIKRRNR